MKKDAATTLIIGGNGKTGRRVAERLRQRGLPFRLASRTSKVPFDWNDDSTWDRAVADVASLYVTYAPDLALPGAASQVHRLSRLAVKRGVGRIVLLAGRGDAQVEEAKQAVRESGASYTIVECAFFAQNFSEGFMAPVDNEIAFPAGHVAEPFIHCDDIADVVVAALTNDVHSGKTYELTGPRLLTFEQAASELASASGRPIRYVPISFEQYALTLAPHFPPPQVELFIELFSGLLDGHNAHTTDDVERILGRKATDFSVYAREAAYS